MRHAIEDALVRALIVVVRFAPEVVVRAMGTSLGLIFYALDRAHRRIAEQNLASAFPARANGNRSRRVRPLRTAVVRSPQVQHVDAPTNDRARRCGR
jgi:lauroyl/myristoyl acyltransferase